MTYLLDSGVFIQSKKEHYRFSICPGFWDWVLREHGNGIVFSIDKVLAELAPRGGQQPDDVCLWARGLPAGFFRASDASVAAAMAQVSAWVSAAPYSPAGIATFMGVADYYIVSHALAIGATVVHHEGRGFGSPDKIKIPDVCIGLGIPQMNTFQMLEDEGARFVL